MHLSDKTLDAIAEGAAPGPELLSHLRSPCQLCEETLSGYLGPGLLDGETDRLLLRLARAESPLDEVGFQRLRRTLRGGGGTRQILSALAGMAAGLLLTVGLLRGDGREEPLGIKGPSRISVELSAIQRSQGRLSRVEPGQEVVAEGELLLRYHATEAGRAALYLERAEKPPERLGAFTILSGTHHLRAQGELAGLSLEGEAGPLTVWLVVVSGRAPPGAELSKKALSFGSLGGRGAVGRLDIRAVPPTR